MTYRTLNLIMATVAALTASAVFVVVYAGVTKGQNHGQSDRRPNMGTDRHPSHGPTNGPAGAADPQADPGGKGLGRAHIQDDPAIPSQAPVPALHLRGSGHARVVGGDSGVFETIHARRLFAAIRQAESGGDDLAVGDGGKSVGPYQCGRLAWIDGGGRVTGGLDGWPQMAYDRKATEAVMLRYWARYGAVTDEQKARIWNGGPRGMSKESTKAYWARVQREILP